MHRILVFRILFCKIVLKFVFCLILAVIFFSNENKIKYQVLQRQNTGQKYCTKYRWTIKQDSEFYQHQDVSSVQSLYLSFSLYPEQELCLIL